LIHFYKRSQMQSDGKIASELPGVMNDTLKSVGVQVLASGMF